MTKELFKDDSYLNECDAVIEKLSENSVTLNQTIFYAEGGGQLGDTGYLIINNEEYRVSNTIRENNKIKHILDTTLGLTEKMSVKCKIDWDRRYKLMKTHSCLHILCSAVDAPVTGGSVGEGKGRLDFDIEEKPNKLLLTKTLQEIINQNYKIKSSWITEKYLYENPQLVKTMSVSPPMGSGKIRMIQIGENIDFQPCGGTHVKNSSEIGEIEVSKVENKGKRNKRVIVNIR